MSIQKYKRPTDIITRANEHIDQPAGVGRKRYMPLLRTVDPIIDIEWKSALMYVYTTGSIIFIQKEFTRNVCGRVCMWREPLLFRERTCT